MKEYKVSIIIPAYNEEKYIEKTILSLINQSYKNFEILVVDNNSKDRTKEIAQKYVKTITEKRQGYIYAVIRGIKETSGEIIGICDADTIYPKNWLEKIIKPFENEKVVAVYGSAMFKDTNAIMKILSFLIYSMFLYISKIFGVENTAGFNFLFRRDAYEKSGGYSPEWKWAGPDIELGNRLKKFGKVVLRLTHVYTSSRRFKKGGYIKTSFMFLKIWWQILRNKPKINYDDYNKQRG